MQIAWALGEDVAPLVRFCQDQPAIHVYDKGGRESSSSFIHDVADWVSQVGIVTAKHRTMFTDIIAERGWEEPPRWRAFAAVENGRWFVYVCPGAGDTAKEINDLCKSRPDGMDCVLTIGAFADRTWDADDPILHRSTYVTPVWRLVEKARAAGTIIGPDRERPPYEPVRCTLHRREPDWRREPYSDEPPWPVTAKMTPEPIGMMIAIRNGAILQERHGDWSDWHMILPDGSRRMVMTRALNRLLETGFVDRAGELPPGHPTSVLEFEWPLTPAGRAWMAANPKAVLRAAKKPKIAAA
jgi:hypothetical protein